VAVLAELAQTAADPISGSLLQYGALGVFLIVALGALRIVYGQTTAAAKADRERADRLEEELRATNRAIQDKHLGVIAEVTHVMQQVLDEVREDRR